jgi:hypothetical protein
MENRKKENPNRDIWIIEVPEREEEMKTIFFSVCGTGVWTQGLHS